MISIIIEYKDNKINLKVEGYGKNKDLVEECTFLISNSSDIYDAVIDHLPLVAQMKVISNTLDTLNEKLQGDYND